MKTLKMFVVALVAVLAVPQAHAAGQLTDGRVKRFDTWAHMYAQTGVSTGQLACVASSGSCYRYDGATWQPTDQRGFEFYVAFNEGASKGLYLTAEAAAGTYSTTADAINYLRYGPNNVAFEFVTNTTAAGTITPVGTATGATGLDIHGASIGTADEFTMTRGGRLPGTGGYVIPGTTPAGRACITYDDSDVSTNAAHCLELTNAAVPQAPADFSSSDPNYTTYAAICNIAGDVKVSDSTTGATDTTANWADDETHKMCLQWAADGVVNYYFDDVLCGSAGQTTCPTTDAFTLSDGLPYLIRFQGLGGTAPDDVIVTIFEAHGD